MKALAEADGDVFLQNPEPECPVQYVLVCMEPSLGRWASGAVQANSRVQSGFRNFLPSDEVALLHFCIRHYLCRAAERYHITDLSKGAMLVEHAGYERAKRYEKMVSVAAGRNRPRGGSGRAHHCGRKRRFPPADSTGFQETFHADHSLFEPGGTFTTCRDAGREKSFRAFSDSVSLDDVVATAKDVLASARVPAAIAEETLSKLRRFQLATSRQQLMFNYKIAFESLAEASKTA